MKIKYKIKETVNGITIGTQFKYSGIVWQRKREGWFQVDQKFHDICDKDSIEKIDENFKNGDYETVENNDLNLELKNG